MTAKADTNPLREALEEISQLTTALRQGGPDPMDLQGLSDALEQATSIAHAALASEPVAGTDQRSSDDESGCPRKCGEATDSGGSGNDRNPEDTMQGDRPAAVVKVPSSERPPAPAGRGTISRAICTADGYDYDVERRLAVAGNESCRSIIDMVHRHADAVLALGATVTPQIEKTTVSAPDGAAK